MTQTPIQLLLINNTGNQMNNVTKLKLHYLKSICINIAGTSENSYNTLSITEGAGKCY